MFVGFDHYVESKIQKAIDNGEFKNLPGFGKPLNLEFMNQPAHIRIATSIMKNANVLPEELQIRKDVYSLRQQLKEAKSERERKDIWKQIRDKSMRYKILIERRGLKPNL